MQNKVQYNQQRELHWKPRSSRLGAGISLDGGRRRVAITSMRMTGSSRFWLSSYVTYGVKHLEFRVSGYINHKDITLHLNLSTLHGQEWLRRRLQHVVFSPPGMICSKSP